MKYHSDHKKHRYELVDEPKNNLQISLSKYGLYFFDKKTGSGVSLNEKLAEIKRRKVYARFKDNIWVADLAEMGLLSSKNENVKYFLCVINIFTKYTWVKPLKDKGKTVLNANIEIVNESNSKTNKSWVIQVREFYNKRIQEWLDDNDILMYMTYNEAKSVISEKLMRTLKDKIYKEMTANDRKYYPSYLNKLEDQYNNNYHRSIGKKLLMLIILL